MNTIIDNNASAVLSDQPYTTFSLSIIKSIVVKPKIFASTYFI